MILPFFSFEQAVQCCMVEQSGPREYSCYTGTKIMQESCVHAFNYVCTFCVYILYNLTREEHCSILCTLCTSQKSMSHHERVSFHQLLFYYILTSSLENKMDAVLFLCKKGRTISRRVPVDTTLSAVHTIWYATWSLLLLWRMESRITKGDGGWLWRELWKQILPTFVSPKENTALHNNKLLLVIMFLMYQGDAISVFMQPLKVKFISCLPPVP